MPTNKELEKNLIEMAKAIKELAIDVAELKAVKTVLPAVPISTVTVVATGNTVGAVNTGNFPIPPEYREIVDKTLNKYFGIEVEHVAAGFIFTVIVPDKYVTLTPREKEMIKQDKRSKLIPNFEGANGVRQWVELVYSSFSNELKSQITADR